MIRIVSDLHTHTRFSRNGHGKGSVEDNVQAAIAKGLSAVAISDHGFSHLFYSISDIDRYLEEIARVKERYADQIKIYASVELNLLSLDGRLDIPQGYENAFDLKMFGYHKLVGYKTMRDRLHFLLPKVSGAKAVAQNTQAYISAMERYRPNMVSHPGYGLPIDKIAVARAAKAFSVALEINASHPEFTAEELQACAETGVQFVIGSDAHSPERVGDFTAAVTRAEQAGLTAKQIINAEQ